MDNLEELRELASKYEGLSLKSLEKVSVSDWGYGLHQGEAFAFSQCAALLRAYIWSKSQLDQDAEALRRVPRGCRSKNGGK